MQIDLNRLKSDVQKIIEDSKIVTFNQIEEDKLELSLELKSHQDQQEIKEQVVRLVKIDYGVPKLKISIEVEKESLMLENAKKIIISSGKGGVGKSSVTANIANALSKSGKKVAVIDADIYGSSIPMIFGLEKSPESDGRKIFPLKYENIELIGTTNVNPNNDPIVWRGPMLGRLLKSFFTDVYWSEDVEYLLIDLPPGTGDIPLDLNQIIPDAKCIVVTTPHHNASKVAIKAGEVAKMQNHKLIGIVENMSYYVHNEEKLFIFGKDGGQVVADKLETSVLGNIPILTPENGDLYNERQEAFSVYSNIVDKIIKSF